MHSAVTDVAEGNYKFAGQLTLHVQRPLVAIADPLIARVSANGESGIRRQPQGISADRRQPVRERVVHVEKRRNPVGLCGIGGSGCRVALRGGIREVDPRWRMEYPEAAPKDCL